MSINILHIILSRSIFFQAVSRCLFLIIKTRSITAIMSQESTISSLNLCLLLMIMY